MLSHEQMKAAERESVALQSIYVYEAPVRIWHWLTALCMVILMGTGYFIGQPFLEQSGDAPDKFIMGYVRFAHFAAAYVFTFGLVGRIYWACVGNSHAKQLFTPQIFDPNWWNEVFFELRWYFFLEDRPKKYAGHNPLALFMMFFVFFLGSLFMIATGFALYSEGAGDSHWSAYLFGWVIPLFGGSQMVHSLHRLVMWYQLCFVLIHVYAGIREDIMSRQSIVSTMLNGWRTFKD